MLALLTALILLALAFRRLFRRSPNSLHSKSAASKPTLAEKLHAEAFEHVHTTAITTPILLLYATEYGFSKEIAQTLAAHLSASSLSVSPRIINVLHHAAIDFSREQFILFICSTTGDGVPPNEAAPFRDALIAHDIRMHQHSSIAILALGDRSYPHFCRAGAIFDNLLPGNRLLPRVDINQEDWPRIKNWMQNIESALADAMSTAPPSHLPDYLTGSINKYAASTCHVDVRYTRRNPFLASITLRQDLTVAMSPVSDPKEVVRIQFDISGSDMRYQVGDALCVVPRNNPDHVTRLLLSLASNGDEMVRINDYSDPVQFEIALTEALDISTIKPELVATLARRCDQAIEYDLGVKILGYDVRMENGVGVSAFGKAYLEEREVFDILSDFVSASISAHELVKVLRPLHARYYSISSTPVTSPNAIDITVDVLRYSSLDVERQGVSSTFLKDRCRVNDTKVALFITKNPNFRLPNDLCRPIIMIGPGTGVAPFVAFVEERIARDATGENVLFFGCRHAKQDFLYRERLLQYNDVGHLQLHTAFSRDSAKKIYVQQRILEHGEQLWSLIHDKSAHIYVCGDGGNMARDVDATLCNIIMQYGCMNKEDADNFIANLSNSKRYQRDVWVS